MLTEYYSLRYINLTDIVCNRRAVGTLVYCYKMIAGVDNTTFMDFIDKHVLLSVQVLNPDAKLCKEEMIDDSKWARWFKMIGSTCVPLNMIPSMSENDIVAINGDVAKFIKLPTFLVQIFNQSVIYKEDPGYPFNRIELRYPIGITPDQIEFSIRLKEFLTNHMRTFSSSLPMLRFQNPHNHFIFSQFYSLYAKRACLLWPELMHLSIDVYNIHHLKSFMTAPGAFYSPAELQDTPYLSFCFRHTAEGTIENDIIENTYLCTNISLTPDERYALIAHELGHFVETARQSTFRDGFQEESTCDQYAVQLGMKSEIKLALQKLLNANVCSQQQNMILTQRIAVL